MIKELAWDSNFFKRKIGELIPVSREPSHIKNLVKRAKEDGFEYIICKLISQDTLFIRLLESLGFYLTDIGVILNIETKVHSSLRAKRSNISEGLLRRVAPCNDSDRQFSSLYIAKTIDDFYQKNKGSNTNMEKSIRIATHQDIPALKRLSKSLFLESRFYGDPFFSEAMADRLYGAWIENSVKGEPLT